MTQGAKSGTPSSSRLAVAITIAALMALSAWLAISARHLYAQRAELRLRPVYQDHFFSENGALGPKKRRRVVFFGDSRISQWRPHPASWDVELLWRGVDGETTAQMAFRFRNDVTAVGADAVVIQAGINDLVAGAALGRIRQARESAFGNIAAMVLQARSAGVQVHLLTVIRPAMPPLWRWPVWSADIAGEVQRLNSSLTALEGVGIVVHGADRALAGDSLTLPRRYAEGTLHLNHSAYARLNDLLGPAFRGGADAVQ